jgi:oxygen-independent coproporphyrinogen-3 oxidase
MAKAGTPQGIGGLEPIPSRHLGLEFMMNALRLTDGFPEMLFQERTGHGPRQIELALDKAIRRGLIQRSAGWIRPTDLGRRFLNDLIQLF